MSEESCLLYEHTIEPSTMLLPHAEVAEIPEAKVRHYLLSKEHKDGRSKALFFEQFGFKSDMWMVLLAALKEHARVHEVSKIETTPFGTKYTIDGVLNTPTGDMPNVRVVWFVERDEEIPRLVTAHPLARKPQTE